MSERRWEELLWCDECGYHHDSDEGIPMTDAEVLAEMGGERMWACAWWDDSVWSDTKCNPHNPRAGKGCSDRCGWVWVVKEADDE